MSQQPLRAEPGIDVLLSVPDDMLPDQSGAFAGGRRLGTYPVRRDDHSAPAA